MKGGDLGYGDVNLGGAKRSKTSNCHCGLPSCICRCAKNNCPKNCRCMKCRRGRKSRRRRSSMRPRVSRGGCIGSDPTSCGGTRRGRPCKATRRKSTRRKSRRGKRTLRKRR